MTCQGGVRPRPGLRERSRSNSSHEPVRPRERYRFYASTPEQANVSLMSAEAPDVRLNELFSNLKNC